MLSITYIQNVPFADILLHNRQRSVIPKAFLLNTPDSTQKLFTLPDNRPKPFATIAGC